MKRLLLSLGSKLKRGYILVITVLFIGAILVATTVSLLILGWAAEQSGVVFAQTSQALEGARGCMDVAIEEFRKDTTYAGVETYVLPNSLGSCNILAIEGSGVMNRTICTEGISGTSTRRVRAVISRFFPTVIITSYQEINATAQCEGSASLSSASSSAGASPGSSASSASSIAAASSAASSLASSAASSDASSAASSAASSVAGSTCGNGVIEGAEQCDDNNVFPNDGCSAICEIEFGCSCGGTPSVCTCGASPGIP